MLVSVILLITLFSIFLMSLHSEQKHEELEMDFKAGIDFSAAVNSTDPRIVNAFCSGLTYKTFEWKYY